MKIIVISLIFGLLIGCTGVNGLVEPEETTITDEEEFLNEESEQALEVLKEALDNHSLILSKAIGEGKERSICDNLRHIVHEAQKRLKNKRITNLLIFNIIYAGETLYECKREKTGELIGSVDTSTENPNKQEFEPYTSEIKLSVDEINELLEFMIYQESLNTP